jgi:hypothetical protein
LAFTLARGPIADFYPYPFVDVDANGYLRVLLNSALIGLLVIGLAAVALWIDAVLARRSTDLRERFRRLGSWRDRLHAARPEDRAELLRAFGFTRKEIARLAQHDRLYEMCALLGACLSNATYDEVGIVGWFRARKPDLRDRSPLDALCDGDFDAVHAAWERETELVAVSDEDLFSLEPRPDGR